MDDNAKEYAFVKEKYGLSEGEYNEFKARGHQLWAYWLFSPDMILRTFYEIEYLRAKLFKSPEEEEKVVNAVKKYFDYINLLKIAKSNVIDKKSRVNKSTSMYDKYGHAIEQLRKAEEKQDRAQAAFDLVREQTIRVVNGKSNNVPFNRVPSRVGPRGLRDPNAPAAVPVVLQRERKSAQTLNWVGEANQSQVLSINPSSTTQLFGTRTPNVPAASTTQLFGTRVPNAPAAAKAPLINNATNSEKKRAIAQLAFLGRPPTSEELAAEITKVKRFNTMMSKRKTRGGKSKKTSKTRRN